MGYSNSVVEEALKQQKFDDCYASYLLLGRRNTDVSIYMVTIMVPAWDTVRHITHSLFGLSLGLAEILIHFPLVT